LNHSLLLSTSYFFPICYTIPNDLNFSSMQPTCLENESKELQPFWTFFYTNMSLWSAAAQIFAGSKKGFLSIQTLISCNLHGEKFWNFFHIFSNQFNLRSYSYMCPKKFFFKNLVLVLEIAILKWFWWKHSLKPLGVNRQSQWLCYETQCFFLSILLYFPPMTNRNYFILFLEMKLHVFYKL